MDLVFLKYKEKKRRTYPSQLRNKDVTGYCDPEMPLKDLATCCQGFLPPWSPLPGLSSLVLPAWVLPHWVPSPWSPLPELFYHLF